MSDGYHQQPDENWSGGMAGEQYSAQQSTQPQPTGQQYQQASQQYSPMGQQPQAPNVDPGSNGRGLAIASLVLGIISTVFGLFGMATIGYLSALPIITGIIGIVLAATAGKKGNTSGMRIAGLILSIIGVALAAIGLVACLTCAAAVGSGTKAIEQASDEIINDAVDEYEKAIDDAMDEYEKAIDEYSDALDDLAQEFNDAFQ